MFGQNNKQSLLRNFIAGTTTAVVLVPQGMAYALVAGLPPIHGLYASLLPLIVYVIIGRSRQLAVGPGALDSLMIGAALSTISFITPETYPGYAALLALEVAVIQLVLGALQAGFLVNFLSRPVISGFTSAAALTVAFSQLGNLLGFSLASSAHFHTLLLQVIQQISQTNLYTAALGLLGIFLLRILKRLKPTLPAPLVVVILTTIITAMLNLPTVHVAIVGNIPRGLPHLQLPLMSWEAVKTLLPTAFALAFVGYLTIISIAKTFANRNGYDIGANRELIALGATNLAAGISQGFAVSSSFSRSAVHAQAGATSRYTLLVCVGWIGLTLMFLTDYFYYLPKATLAAIIITAVLSLVDFKIVKQLYRVKPADMWLLLITFFATLFIGIESGIGIGVACSLGLFLYRTTRPHTAVLGRIGTSQDFRNIKYYPEAKTYPGVLILRIDAQFYFGNVTFLKELLKQLEQQQTTPLRFIIIEACSLNQLDSSADAALHEIADQYRRQNIELFFASVKAPVMAVMKASGLYTKLGADHFFMNVHDAVETCLKKTAAH